MDFDARILCLFRRDRFDLWKREKKLKLTARKLVVKTTQIGDGIQTLKRKRNGKLFLHLKCWSRQALHYFVNPCNLIYFQFLVYTPSPLELICMKMSEYSLSLRRNLVTMNKLMHNVETPIRFLSTTLISYISLAIINVKKTMTVDF